MNNPPRSWLKLTLDCPVAHADTVAALLASCSAGGVEYGYRDHDRESDREELSVYLEQDAHLEQHLQIINDFLDRLRQQNPAAAIAPPQTEVIADCDWNAVWKKAFTPLAVVPGLVIKPTWESYIPATGEQVIEMDPGQAFGTGHHASTRLALQLLRSLLVEPGEAVSTSQTRQTSQDGGATQTATTSRPLQTIDVLDVGCGTGILAMAAARWGATRITATDHDPLAVEATRHNVENNRLSELIRVTPDPLTELERPFAVVLANITADVLLGLASDLVRLVAPGGHLILAGILVNQQESAVSQRFEELGIRILARPRQDEWVAMLGHKTHQTAADRQP